MTVLIKMTDGRIVTPDEHYLIICERFGLSGTKSIHRHPDNPDIWYEDSDEYEWVEDSENLDSEKIMAHMWEQSRLLAEIDEILEKGV